MSVIPGGVLRPTGRTNALLVGPLLLAAVGLCVAIDIGLLGWIRVGPPAGKGDLFFFELVVLIAAGLVIAAAAILTPARFRMVLPFAWVALAWHTGFQVPLSSNYAFAITVFDVLVPLTLFMGIIGEWYRTDIPVRTWTDQHRKLLLVFWAFCLWGLCLALVRDVSLQPMLANLKSYIFYPTIALTAPWCIRSAKQLYLVVAAMLLLMFERVLDGLYQFATHHTHFETRLPGGLVVPRIDGHMADTNQFAMYILSGVLIATALVLAGRPARMRLLVALPLLLGALALFLTFTRGAWLGLTVGLIVISLSLRVRKTLPLLPLIGLAVVVIQVVHPGALNEILLRSTDRNSSIVAREHYYSLGFSVLQHYPFGAGWGAFFQQTAAGLVPSGLFPWYHDDYMQLATEIGIPGLLVFLALVGSMLLYAFRAYLPCRQSPEGPLLVGLMAAFTAMLVQSGTDQFIWHADIAPHIWIVAGLMLSCAGLLKLQAGDTTTTRADVVRKLRGVPLGVGAEVAGAAGVSS